MAGNITALKNAIKDILENMTEFDGTVGKTQDDAINEYSEQLGTAIVNYISSLAVVATPAQIASAAMSNSGGPVVAANNLISSIQ